MRTPILLIALSLLFLQSATWAAQDLDPVPQRIVINGAETPKLMPLGQKMHAFIRSKKAKSVVFSELIPEDREALLRVFFDAGVYQAKASAAERVRLRAIKCGVDSSSKSASDMAIELQQLEDENAAALDKMYESALSTLTKSGRLTLLRFIDEKVVPTLVYQRADWVALAKMSPSMIKSSRACKEVNQ